MQWHTIQRMALGGILLTCMVIAVPGCGTGKTSDRDISWVSATEADSLSRDRTGILGIGRKDGAVLVDPRTVAAYEKGHIPGAVSLPFQFVARDYKPLLEYDSIIVYGDTYNDPKAKAMSKRLIELGCDNVKTLQGGLEAWTAAGLELEQGPPKQG